MKTTPEKNGSRFSTRLICALLSGVLPGFGQAIQRRNLRAFDFLVLYGTCTLVALLYVIQFGWGIWTPITMILLIVIPSTFSFLDAFFDRSSPGDSDTVVRSIIFFVFLYIVTLGPLHFINYIVGFKVYRLPKSALQIEPYLQPGDAVIFDRDAYGIRSLPMQSDSVHPGDIVFHKLKHNGLTHGKHHVHLVLASPLDTIVSKNNVITVNGRRIIYPTPVEYRGERDFGPVIVPKDELFVIDNTWDFFPIYLKDVTGRAIGVLWSQEYGGDFRMDRFGMRLSPIKFLEDPVVFPDLDSIAADSTESASDSLR